MIFNLNVIANFIGYGVIISLGILLIGFFLWISYYLYDTALGYWIDKRRVEIRKNLLKYMKNREKIDKILAEMKE